MCITVYLEFEFQSLNFFFIFVPKHKSDLVITIPAKPIYYNTLYNIIKRYLYVIPNINLFT